MTAAPGSTTPRFAAALSKASDTRQAATEASQQVVSQLGTRPNLAFVFASFDHQPNFGELATIVREQLGTDCVLGCTGESIVGTAEEVEGSSALAVWAAHLPGTTLLPMHLSFERAAEGGSFVGWHDRLLDGWPMDSSLLLLADPFSFPADVLLAQLNDEQPGLNVHGGMASGGWGPGQNRLLLGGRAIEAGAVAVVVQGPIKLRSVVSQGCRPIGRPFVVTKAERNMIFELGGRSALEQLQEMFTELPPDDQALARQGLHLGQVINEYQDQFGRGDFLVRNVQGADSQTGAIVIGDYVRVGQTVQLHVRDSDTADEDLNLLVKAAKDAGSSESRGALVFTCNGRGTRLFSAPHHDAQVLANHWPGLPTAGFFAQGEIGPVGGKNFLHGFTASIVLFEA